MPSKFTSIKQTIFVISKKSYMTFHFKKKFKSQNKNFVEFLYVEN